MKTQTQPALFISHGAPLLALETGPDAEHGPGSTDGGTVEESFRPLYLNMTQAALTTVPGSLRIVSQKTSDPGCFTNHCLSGWNYPRRLGTKNCCESVTHTARPRRRRRPVGCRASG